jgi:hypothetical protein
MKKIEKRVRLTPDEELETGIQELIASVKEKTEVTLSRSQALAWLTERGLKSWKRKGNMKVGLEAAALELEPVAQTVKPVETPPAKRDDPLMRIIKSQERDPWSILKQNGESK